ncbi:Vacuolar protein sorting-associated protein 9a [Astathelohania contejeani]|uniref:Vacuolar protein sorting-associated protein 9a n=1 Tax=Astathelohania contejeani TaxID=164912 RepID=A0ABQ7I1C2_9MICR|nr:Vacuolar protein sorting-associated protein 9a [Thelohania contejeani]
MKHYMITFVSCYKSIHTFVFSLMEFQAICKKQCVYYFLKRLNDEPSGETFTMVENAINDIVALSSNDTRINTMYTYVFDYLSTIRFIHCEIGMFYLEKYFMTSAYKIIFYKDVESDKNIFISNKIILFQWIDPAHIDIQYTHNNFLNAISCIRKINSYFTPTEKIHCIMSTVKSIYRIIGRSEGQDKFFPAFVYTLIKSKVDNLYLNYQFIKTFKRPHFTKCNEKCIHVGNSKHDEIINCPCVNKILTEEQSKEIDYYLITFRAAILYIERIEYQNLNVDKEIFDSEVSKVVHHIKTSKLKSVELVDVNKSYFNVFKNKILNLIKKTFKE